MRRLPGRLFSPLGFVLVGLLFLLPFVTASCTASPGTFNFSYSGVALATGHRPTIDPRLYRLASSQDSRQTPTQVDTEVWRVIHPLAAQWTLTAAFAIVVLGVLTMLIRRPRARVATGMCLALAGAAALLVAATLAERAVYRRFAVDTKALMTSGQDSAASYLSVGGGSGLWLAVGLLVVIFVGNGWHLARLYRPPSAAPAPAGGSP
jgi:hypothetical protein